MIKDEIEAALAERLRIVIETHDEWDYGIQLCIDKEVAILSGNISQTIYFFEAECTDEELYWLSEVFDEVIEKTQSKALIQALRLRLARVTRDGYNQNNFKSEHMRKWVDYDEYVRSIGMDIDYAEEYLK